MYNHIVIYVLVYPVFLYMIPPPDGHTRKICAPDGHFTVSQVSTGHDLSKTDFTYFKDYRKMYKELLIDHGRLMRKLLSANKKLVKTKKDYREFIKITLGLPEDIETTTKITRVSLRHTRPKSALAPGFVLSIADAAKEGKVQMVPDEGKNPATADVSKTITDIQTSTSTNRSPLTLGETEPEGPNIGPVNVVVPSPPVSPKRAKVSSKIIRTPQKQGNGKRGRATRYSSRILKRLRES